MYARGILFGKMKYELGDHAVVRCPETGLEADIEFKVKGWVGGSYNAIGGNIKDSKTGKNLFELSGSWTGEMHIKDLSTGKKTLLFDASHAKPSYPKSRPMEEQAPRESQKLWNSTTQAIKKADQKTATDEKSKIEDEQRREASERGESSWQPKLFKPAPAGDEQNLDWIIDATVDPKAPVEQQIQQILAIAPIIPGQGSQNQNAQQSQAKAPAPATASAGGDLIDFGQNDGTTEPVKPAPSAQQPPNGGLQQPLVPSGSAPAARPPPGAPVKRMDSMGNEETFIDAEP